MISSKGMLHVVCNLRLRSFNAPYSYLINQAIELMCVYVVGIFFHFVPNSPSDDDVLIGPSFVVRVSNKVPFL